MSDINDEVVQMLAKYIIEAVKYKIAQAPFDRIVDGVITSVNNNIYTVTISGSVYSISDVNTHNIDERVKVMIPQNDNDRMFILSLTGSGGVSADAMLKSMFATNVKADSGYVDNAINSDMVGGKSATDFAPASHVGSTGSAHGVATTGSNGFISSTDKAKLDGVSSGANKTETSTFNGNIKTDGVERTVYTHPAGTNPHGTTKADVGLGNVDNTSDVNKPISTAVQTALNSKLNSTSNAVSASKILESDVRNTNETPQWYITTYGKSNVYEFKTNSTIGLSTAFPEVPIFSEVSTYVSWSDSTGGYPVQLAVNNVGIYWRHGISTTTWGAWNKFVKTTDIPTALPANGGNADTVNNHTVEVDVPADALFTDTITTINGKTGAIQKADITALGIPAQDTVYTHPATHSADIITDGTTNKAFTSTEKNKLAGIASGAEVNVQPDWNATSGDGQILNKPTTVAGYGITDVYTKTEVDNKVSAVYKYKGDVSTYSLLPSSNLTIGDVYNVTDTGINYAWNGTKWDDIGGVEALATLTNNGLMSKEDFSKLAGIEAGANKYILPVAGASLGGVKSGTDITVDASGNVSVNDDSHNHVIGNVDGLQTALDGKSASQHTHTANDLPYIYNLNTESISANVTSANYFVIAETDINPNEYFAKLKIVVTSPTNASIHHTLLVEIIGNGISVPYASIDSSISSASATNSGIAYLRVLYPKTENNGYKAVVEVYSYDATSRDITVELLESKNMHLSTAITVTTYSSTYQSAYTTGALYYSAKISSTMYASITGSAGSAGYSSYGVLGGVTISNLNDKTGLWEYFGNWVMAYNSSYLEGRSGNIAVRLRELSSDGSKNLDELDDFVVKIKYGMVSHTDATTFNSTIPTINLTVEGKTSLTGNDFAALVYSTSTANKYIRFYIKLKDANTVYTIEPDSRYGRDYSNTNAQNTGNYFSYASEQTPIVALPTPAQGSVIYATKILIDANTLEGKSSSEFSLIGHNHIKSEVGLGSVDNTSDVDKPISTATQSALNTKQSAITSGTTDPTGGVDGDVYFKV